MVEGEEITKISRKTHANTYKMAEVFINGEHALIHIRIFCSIIADSFRVTLFIDLGSHRILGQGSGGALGTFMINRPI